jgi:predicted unusual protein kinase regulating ubiquinone biosynthesis (AarF/ABC1/UbiB family)
VAVKVQRPDALSIVAQDLVILKRGLEYYKGSILALWRDMGIACECDAELRQPMKVLFMT